MKYERKMCVTLAQLYNHRFCYENGKKIIPTFIYENSNTKKNKTKITKFINTELKSDFMFGVRVRIRVKV